MGKMSSPRRIIKRSAAVWLSCVLICISCIFTGGMDALAASKSTAGSDSGKSSANASKAVKNYRYTSEAAYVKMIRKIARKVGLKYDYLPSVLAAQCILETGYGGYNSESTAIMVRHNNHLGMKSSLINSTWKGHSVWSGVSYSTRTPEYYGGTLVHITDGFRVYSSVTQCLTDYVQFMKWARLPNGRYKYRHDVIGNPSYTSTIYSVMNNGYCTDPRYADSVIRLIRKWHLTNLDDGFMVRVKKVILSRKTTIKLKKGRTFALTAKVKPSNAAIKTVWWASSDPEIASVDSNGVVTARKKGTAYIYAISKDRTETSASVKVKVRN